MKKTIFIAVFEGVEAKNILRTSILPTLFTDPEVRLVLFMKNKERIKYYQKELSDPRISYEFVEHAKPKGLDKLFSALKFTALRTDTTQGKRRMILAENKHYILFALGAAFNWFFSRKTVIGILRRLDFLLVRNITYQIFFDRYKPDLVFLAHLFNEPEIHLLREAKKRGIKTVGLINSWDKVTTRSMIRLKPDHLIVFNDIVREELVRYGNFKQEKIFVSGLPQYDFYFTERVSSREKFFHHIGIDPNKKLIVYAPLGASFGSSDWDMIDFFHNLLEEKKFGENLALLVRFQPNDFIFPEDIKKRPWLVYDYPGIRFSWQRGVDWDMGSGDIAHLKDTLYHMSLLVCFASSLSIDAVVFDKPVINIGFEFKPVRPTQSAMQYFEREHYKKALATGGIRFVKTKEELIEWVTAYLEHSEQDKKERLALVMQQCKFTDGKSGERIGNFLLKLIS